MADRSKSDAEGPGAPATGDFGRRVAARRAYLGLSRRDVALRTASAPGYIEYVETHPGSHGMGFMLRLAHALETTVDELTGGTVDLPPGVGRAAGHPQLVELSQKECWMLVGDHGIGRVVVSNQRGPAVYPVNYVCAENQIAYRTSQGSGPADAAGKETAFEVDHIDDAFSRGWSVLIVGEATAVVEAQAIERLEQESGSVTPWAGGEKDLWIALTANRVTGRRIVTGEP
ncbi:helix-turn-helix domain-containing protein [Streptomyces mutomycini]|uniref:Helix-turn-helix domain-containing protein n=1 Tax=Streptomyces mutomycini TaxID=284036 RepID=A0ABW0B6K1_9ACTN|nr:pyridoxamine 5'-phosphate oxidase family protein [Streptomyces mutomycini]